MNKWKKKEVIIFLIGAPSLFILLWILEKIPGISLTVVAIVVIIFLGFLGWLYGKLKV